MNNINSTQLNDVVVDNGYVEGSSTIVVTTTEDENDGNYSVEDISQEAIALADANDNINSISFEDSLSGETIAIDSSLESYFDEDWSVSIIGLEQDPTFDAGLTLDIAAVTDVNIETPNLIEDRIQNYDRVIDRDLTNTIFNTYEANSINVSALQTQENEGEESSTIVVSTLEDENDDDYSQGDLSLREAIALANVTEGEDTITFENSLNGSITLTNGELTVEDALVIKGLGAENLTIDANNQSRVFRIDDGNDNTINVAIEGLTITGGELVPAQSNNSGGGIFTRENLELSDSKISGNAAVISGGGIYSSGERLVINDSIIEDNSAFLPVAVSTSEGGGIATVGTTVEINDSVIANNSSSLGGGGINAIDSQVSIFNGSITDNFGLDAGAISAVNSTINLETVRVANNATGIFEGSGAIKLDSDSVLNLNRSIISGNFGENPENPLPPGSEAYASGIGNAGVANITDSTISNNTGIGFGVRNSGELNVTNSTFSDNDNAGINSQDGTVAISNSTIADGISLSFDADGSTANISSSILVNDSEEIIIDDNNNLTGNFSSLLLGELQDNGGATPTIALLENSPAIDAGSNPNNLTFDQRGEGFERTIGNGTDIGAYEVQTISDRDDIIGTDNSDFLQGTAENDRIFGLDSADFIDGLDGDDFLSGGNDDDYLKGGNGSDTVEGDAGNDLIEGDAGFNLLRGGDGHDRIIGGAEVDIIDDGVGNDVLFGGDSEDRFLASNPGYDLFTGGNGNDFYIYNLNPDAGFFDRDRILDFNQSEDWIAFRPLVSNLATFDEFADLDTNGSGVLDSDDERIQILDSATIIDFSDLYGRDLNSDTIAFVGITNLDESNFLFNETVAGTEFS